MKNGDAEKLSKGPQKIINIQNTTRASTYKVYSRRLWWVWKKAAAEIPFSAIYFLSVADAAFVPWIMSVSSTCSDAKKRRKNSQREIPSSSSKANFTHCRSFLCRLSQQPLDSLIFRWSVRKWSENNWQKRGKKACFCHCYHVSLDTRSFSFPCFICSTGFSPRHHCCHYRHGSLVRSLSHTYIPLPTTILFKYTEKLSKAHLLSQFAYLTEVERRMNSQVFHIIQHTPTPHKTREGLRMRREKGEKKKGRGNMLKNPKHYVRLLCFPSDTHDKPSLPNPISTRCNKTDFCSSTSSRHAHHIFPTSHISPTATTRLWIWDEISM